MLTEFSHVFAFFILAILFVAGGLVTSRLIRPNKPNAIKLAPYECGEDPVGPSWIKFNIRYYVVALIFVLFDVEVLFLFPWAVVLRRLGGFALMEMFTFVGILLIGYAYVWAKGDLDWARPRPFVARLSDLVTVRTESIGARPVTSQSERVG